MLQLLINTAQVITLTKLRIADLYIAAYPFGHIDDVVKTKAMCLVEGNDLFIGAVNEQVYFLAALRLESGGNRVDERPPQTVTLDVRVDGEMIDPASPAIIAR